MAVQLGKTRSIFFLCHRVKYSLLAGKRQLKIHVFPPENCTASNTKGEKGTKFLLTNNLLIGVV